MTARSVSPPDDFVLPFQIDGTSVRGRLVRLGASVDEILSRHAYPPAVSELLGQAAALTAMLGSALKFDGKLILQTKGDGPVSMLVADYAADGALRGYAAVDPETRPAPQATASALVGRGHMALTVDQGPDMDRYQGVTPLDGETLEAWALCYFAQSEQIPTALKLAVGRSVAPGGAEAWRAGGVMVQLMPSEGGERGEAAPLSAAEDDQWRRSAMLLDTTMADELLDPTLEASALLYRLFHEDGVRVFEPSPLRFACSCEREKIERVLTRYPQEDLIEMAEDGLIRATCEFCTTVYVFDPEEIAAGRG